MYSTRFALAAAAFALVAVACGGTSTTTTSPATATTAAPATTAGPTPTTTAAPVTTTTTTAPVTTTTTTPDPIKRDLIEVRSPTAGDVVTSPLVVTGESNTFEATVSYRLSAGGTVLEEGFITGGGSGEWAPFEITIEFENTCCTEMLLEVFENSAKDGSEINKVTIPLTFPETG